MVFMYTETSGRELYEEGKNFYASDTKLNVDEDSELYEVSTENAVKLQIQYEKDGVKVYNVNPEQVFKMVKIK